MNARKTALAATAVLAGLLVLVLVVPAMLDWNRLRPEAEAAASAALRRPVRISGPIAVRLLPTPTATLSGLSVGDAGAERLSVSLRLLPLLSGQRQIDELTLAGGRLGPLKAVEARITPEGAIQARGKTALSPLGEADTTFDGQIAEGKVTGLLRLALARASAQGQLSLSADELAIPDLVVTLGQSTANIALVAGLGTQPVQIDITAKGGVLDLDSLTAPPQSQTAAPTVTAAAPPPPPTQQQPEPTAAPAGRFSLPGNLTLNLDAAVDGLRWNGLTLGQTQMSALLDQGIVTLGHATTHWAETGEISLSGTLASRDDRLVLAPLALTTPAFRATGELSIAPTAPVSVSLKLSSQGMEAGYDGTLSNGTVSLRAASFAQAANRLTGHQPRGGGPLAVTTRLRLDATQAVFDQLQARLGETLVTGTGRLDLVGRVLTADLASPAVAVAPFLGTDTKPGAIQSWRLDEVAARVVATGSTLSVERLNGRMLGGALAAAAKANAAGIAVTATLKGADIGGMGLGAGGVKATRGRLDAQTRLAARGTTQAQWQASLTGDGRLDVSDGLVEGFDLAAMDAQMRKLDNIGSLLGLVQAGLSGGTSSFSTLGASFKADRGVVTSNDITLVAEGGGADGTAVVDLPKDMIDARLAFRLATPGSPPLGLRLQGRLASPNKIIDVNALQRYVVERGLGKAIKGKSGGLIESLLGIKRHDKKE
ncbi:hypothetical protein CU669_12785 [Paramagnetospirillum kuznetsovii]|uniref:AsmA domain-containing protein n=1 Tax=Paramagnetospirillum kuznetsovii TaxID=2053833 RepID=A0A364NWY1_9PROT|nr:AsmA family protein [Paramagnetospirillum kuznetsovii]RAU21563.1 hypothetical protein CU669_12785 [Paramagnetospirillum kuznetsovii]